MDKSSDHHLAVRYDDDARSYFATDVIRDESFSLIYPDFDTGESRPYTIYPIEHGVGCTGHPREHGLVLAFKWTYVQKPAKPYEHHLNVVWANEKYL